MILQGAAQIRNSVLGLHKGKLHMYENRVRLILVAAGIYRR